LAVRAATGGETLVTLDGQTRKLEAGDLMICDAEGPIGLAGVMGGQNSEVKDDTRTIVIEVAAFAPIAVRKTARRLALHSEASRRFERGVNVDNLPKVAHRVAELIAALLAEAKAGTTPEIAHDHIDEYPSPVAKRVVTLRLSRTRDVLGVPHLTGAELQEILTALDFEMLDHNDDRYVFEVPFWRNDVEREVDLIEEVARLRGYDKITPSMPVMSLKTVQEDPFIDFADDVRVLMASAGFNETITFPFLAAKELAGLGVEAGHPLFPTLSLANPISEEHALLQTTLVPGLLRSLAGNRRQGVHGAKLFECGRGYANGGGGGAKSWDETRYPNAKALARHGRHLTRRAKAETERPYERHLLTAVLDQPLLPKNWNTPETAAGFFHGKAAVQGFLASIGVAHAQFQAIAPSEWPFLHPGAAANVVVNGKWAGFVGELHPKSAAAFDLAHATEGAGPIVFELDLETLFNARALNRAFDPLQRRFPPVSRDLALLLDKERTHQDVVDAIRAFKRKKHLSRYTLFDVYEGDKLPAGKKSMAYSFSFQSAERTLSDKEVEPEIAALLEWLGEKVGATQR
jgi:phenylalanyl-tRNA synthetase beta chain